METKCRSSVAPPYVKSDYNGGPSHQYYNRPGIVDWLRETTRDAAGTGIQMGQVCESGLKVEC